MNVFLFSKVQIKWTGPRHQPSFFCKCPLWELSKTKRLVITSGSELTLFPSPSSRNHQHCLVIRLLLCNKMIFPGGCILHHGVWHKLNTSSSCRVGGGVCGLRSCSLMNCKSTTQGCFCRATAPCSDPHYEFLKTDTHTLLVIWSYWKSSTPQVPYFKKKKKNCRIENMARSLAEARRLEIRQNGLAW